MAVANPHSDSSRWLWQTHIAMAKVPGRRCRGRFEVFEGSETEQVPHLRWPRRRCCLGDGRGRRISLRQLPPRIVRVLLVCFVERFYCNSQKCFFWVFFAFRCFCRFPDLVWGRQCFQFLHLSSPLHVERRFVRLGCRYAFRLHGHVINGSIVTGHDFF